MGWTSTAYLSKVPRDDSVTDIISMSSQYSIE